MAIGSLTTTNLVFLIYSIFLIIFGTASNVLTIALCLRKTFRIIPTYNFIFCIACMDIPSLIIMSFNIAFQSLYGTNIFDKNKIECHLHMFLVSFFTLTSAWLLVAMSIERCLTVKIKNWRKVKFNSKKAVILSCIIMVIAFCLNIHVIFGSQFILIHNSTHGSICIYNEFSYAWLKALLYLYSLIPFVIMAIADCILIMTILKKNHVFNVQTRQESFKRRKLSVSVILLTLGYMIMTAPNAVSTGYFLDVLIISEAGLDFMTGANLLLITYKCIIFFFSFKPFIRELGKIFGIKKARSSRIIPKVIISLAS